MLEKLQSLLRLTDDGDVRAVLGDLPGPDKIAALRSMLAERPAARKFPDGMAITVPLTGKVWHVWTLSVVPAVTDLADVMQRLQALSRGIEADRPKLPDDAVTKGGGVMQPMVHRVTGRLRAGRLPKAPFLAAMLLDDLVEHGGAEGAALLVWRSGKLQDLWFSDQRLAAMTDEVRALAQAARRDAPRRQVIPADMPDDDDLELAVLARQAGTDTLALVLPGLGQDGYGIIAFGGRVAAPAAVVDTMAFAHPIAQGGKSRRGIRGLVIAATLAALALWLAWPAPVVVAATGVTYGADVTVASLNTDAFVRKAHVRIGDTVQQGDVLGEFFSPSIEEARAEEELTVSVEQLNAQAALAKSDYAAYQLAEQRLLIAQTRLEQLNMRAEDLLVRAPVAGRVIGAISDNMNGNYSPAGQDVAVIQTSDRINIRLSLPRMDAHLVQPGMSGEVYFKGMGNAAFAVEIVTPAAAIIDEATGRDRMEATARVVAADSSALIVGMAGVARLNAGQAPRIVGLGRYVTEFFRVTAWTYLGLRF